MYDTDNNMTTVTATGAREMRRKFEEMIGRECTATYLDQIWFELFENIEYENGQYSFTDDGTKWAEAVRKVA